MPVPRQQHEPGALQCHGEDEETVDLYNGNGKQQLCGFDVVRRKRVSMAKSACVVDSTWSRAEPLYR